MNCIVNSARDMLATIQKALFDAALAFRNANMRTVNTYDEFQEAVTEGFVMAWWCGERECEAAIKEDTKATSRCIPFDQPGGTGNCVRCGKTSKEQAVFARSY
jgi:prolyl-tRNA synthetase